MFLKAQKKIIEKLFHHNEGPTKAVPDLNGDSMAEYEQKKVAGAIRTDFILSAEIIVIALGTVQGQPVTTQVLVVSLIAIIMTIGVYGLVAGIVKLDDLGFFLERKSQGKGPLLLLGKGLIAFAPKLMRNANHCRNRGDVF